MLESLRVFRFVAATRSFTAAARQAALTRPAVSQHIRRLERLFGTRLLVRTTRRVELTEAGRILLTHAERVLEEVERLERAMRELSSRRITPLTVGASTLPGEYLLPRALLAFRDRFPETEVRVWIGDTEAVVGWVRAGQVELGFVGQPPTSPELVVEPVVEDEIVLLLPPGYPPPDPLDVEALTRIPLVLREPGSATRATVLSALEQAGVPLARLRVAGQLGSPEALKAAVRAGMGAAFLSRFCLRPEEGPAVRVQGLPLRRWVCACWHRTRPPDRFGQALIELLRTLFGSA
ncbi:MAG: LysR family transcriptional regulator [Armatimonadetes bacterium]|nr:LysR family transcriptional regulator [Armatimonadota bacterium]MDW8154749.1 LysR family transcriptional regulator [Armatimonadota bacterium]